MTYGWMLLVIAIVGGLLFALFQDQQLQNDSVEGFEEDEDLRVTDVGLSGSSLDLRVENQRPEPVEDVEVCLNNSQYSENCGSISSIDTTGAETLSLANYTSSNSTISYDVTVSATVGDLNPSTDGTVNVAAKPQ
jgi:hypothetical protein